MTNPESLISQGCPLNFVYGVGRCKTINAEAPTDAIAYPESDMQDMLTETGIAILSRHYGSRCGRNEFLSHQDIFILERTMP